MQEDGDDKGRKRNIGEEGRGSNHPRTSSSKGHTGFEIISYKSLFFVCNLTSAIFIINNDDDDDDDDII